MDETTQEVVEDNNLSAQDETTLTEQTTNDEVAQPEQAADTEQSDTSEPSESSDQPEEEREVKRLPRAERRFDQMTAKMAELSKQAQLQPAQYLNNLQAPEFDDPEFDQAVNAKVQAISQAQNASLIAQLNARDTVSSYINNVTEDKAYLQTKYDVLNPEKPEYDPEIEELITDFYEAENPIEVNGAYNSNVKLDKRLRDAAEKVLKNVEKYQQKGQSQAQVNLTQAQDNAVVTPTGAVATKGEETLDEMRDRLAGVTF